MKYGSALHVSLLNEEFKISIKLIRMMKSYKDIDYRSDFNKIDEEGNSPLHILMKIYGADPVQANKIVISLIKKGASFCFKNKN